MKEPAPTWDEFLRVRGVDYKEDEILPAQTMRWQNVAPALPQEVGAVPLEDVVGLGCKLTLRNIYWTQMTKSHVKRLESWSLPKTGSCSVQSSWRGIFDKVHEDDLYEIKGQPLLNGLFGVSKNEFEDGWEAQRIIMNLIPLNGVCRSFDGDVSTLPSWAGMNALHLQPHEDLLVSSEDVRCFFYIFRVPPSLASFSCLQSTIAFPPQRW